MVDRADGKWGTREGGAEELERLVRERTERREDCLKWEIRRPVNKKMKNDVVRSKIEAYYLKKRNRKMMKMEVKFVILRKSGGDDMVDGFLAKKRK